MRNKLIMILLVVSLLGFSSCMGPLTEKDSGRTIELSEDSPLSIELKGNPNTSSWKVMEYDHTVIEQTGDVLVTPSGNESIFEFNFRVVAEGSTTLLIAYVDNDDPSMVEKVFELHVISGTMGRIEDQ